jgi:hypothetical protein
MGRKTSNIFTRPLAAFSSFLILHSSFPNPCPSVVKFLSHPWFYNLCNLRNPWLKYLWNPRNPWLYLYAIRVHPCKSVVI